MLPWILICIIAFALDVLGCASHDTGRLTTAKGRRQEDAADPPIPVQRPWDYAASWNWANINPDAYGTCQNGTQQSPIPLSLYNGLSQNHIPTFNYPPKVLGNFKNWGFGPAFDVIYDADNITGNPSMVFDNETVYLVGWHTHTPADHTVNGVRSRAELHLVHKNSDDEERAILAILIEPGNEQDPFIEQFPTPLVKFNTSSPNQFVQASLDMRVPISRASDFREFWTYEGSLTSPPCGEGKRWFVARQTMYTSVDQMRMILHASSYSARAEQMVWQHKINE